MTKREYMRIYRDTHPECRKRENIKCKQYQKTLHGRLAHRAASTNTNAKNRGDLHRISKNELLSIWLAHGGVEKNGEIVEEPSCILCGQRLDTFSYNGFFVDHIIPICLGGENVIQNIQLLCSECNYQKSSREKNIKRISNVDYKELLKEKIFINYNKLLSDRQIEMDFHNEIPDCQLDLF